MKTITHFSTEMTAGDSNLNVVNSQPEDLQKPAGRRMVRTVSLAWVSAVLAFASARVEAAERVSGGWKYHGTLQAQVAKPMDNRFVYSVTLNATIIIYDDGNAVAYANDYASGSAYRFVFDTRYDQWQPAQALSGAYPFKAGSRFTFAQDVPQSSPGPGLFANTLISYGDPVDMNNLLSPNFATQRASVSSWATPRIIGFKLGTTAWVWRTMDGKAYFYSENLGPYMGRTLITAQ